MRKFIPRFVLAIFGVMFVADPALAQTAGDAAAASADAVGNGLSVGGKGIGGAAPINAPFGKRVFYPGKRIQFEHILALSHLPIDLFSLLLGHSHEGVTMEHAQKLWVG